MENITINISAGKKCNFDCKYCFDQTVPKIKKYDQLRFSDDMIPFLLNMHKKYSIKHVWFSGGEPMLVRNIVDVISTLTNNGILVGMNTNLTASFTKLIQSSDTSNIIFQPAIHFAELERHGKKDIFIKNYNELKNTSKATIIPIAIAYPEITKDDVKKYRDEFTGKHGIEFTFTPYMGIHKDIRYPEKYQQDQIDYFGIQKIIDDTHNNLDIHNKGVLCYAGANHILITDSGDVYPCDDIYYQTVPGWHLGHISEGIVELFNSPIKCPTTHCGCPFFRA